LSDKKDYYELLGVERNADEAELKRAYRKMAMKYHPDRNPDDKGAEAQFKEVNEAYEILSDKEKRNLYDQFGHAGVNQNMGGGGFQGGGFGGFEDIINEMFGGGFGGGGGSRRQGPRKGQDLRADVTMTFEQAAFGKKESIEFYRTEDCPTCDGHGAEPGTATHTCSKCSGTGEMRVAQRSLFGETISVRTCDACNGKGKTFEKVCHTCKGKGRVKKKKTIEVDIPAGVFNGAQMSLRGEGDLGSKGGPRGDVIVVIRVQPHKEFQRDGNDIFLEMPISYAQSVLGDEVDVPTLDGKVQFKIPAGTPSGKQFRLKGKGVPVLNGYGRGDQYVRVFVDVPKNLNGKQKAALKAFAAAMGDPGYKTEINETTASAEIHEESREEKGFFGKMKDAFSVE